MSLVLSEDETMLADAARGLIERAAPVAAFRALRDGGAERRYDPVLLAQLAENGLIAPNIPESHGGVGLGAAAVGVIAEQAGHSLAASPALSAAMAAHLLVRSGGAADGAHWLPQIAAGTAVVAVALDETSRHDPDRLATRAVETVDGWRLSGHKTAVIDGVGADAYLVSSVTETGPALFLVTAGSDGLVTEAIDGIDSRNLARLRLEDVAATPMADGDAAAAIAGARDLGRAVLAAELLGIADEAFTRTIGYLREREQFGRKIGAFQAMQHRAARLYARLDLARGVVLKALRAIDAEAADASLLASLAKGVMTKLARDVLAEAVQMHGGIGVTDEFDIGLYFKRVRVAGDLMGDAAFHTERLARERWGL